MRKKLYFALGLIIAAVMILSSCGGSNSGGGTAPPPSGGGGTTAPAAEPEDDGTVYVADINITAGELSSPLMAERLKLLEELGGGRIQTNVYWAGSLVPIPDVPKALQSGGMTFGNLPTPNYPDILPLTCRILQLPFMGLQDPMDSQEIYMQLLDEFPEIMEEMARFNILPLSVATLGMYDLHFNDKVKEIRLPGDLDGRKMVPFNLTFLPIFEANNAAGSYIPPGQMYENLEKGMVDGYINNWAFARKFGLTDLVEQHMQFGDYGAFHEFNLLVINLDYYNSLPADIQKIWVDVFRTTGGYKDVWGDEVYLTEIEIAAAKDKDDLITTLTPEEYQVWKDALLPQHTVVLDEICAARGDNVAYDIYERAKEIISEKYGS